MRGHVHYATTSRGTLLEKGATNSSERPAPMSTVTAPAQTLRTRPGTRVDASSAFRALGPDGGGHGKGARTKLPGTTRNRLLLPPRRPFAVEPAQATRRPRSTEITAPRAATPCFALFYADKLFTERQRDPT
jgi:hypothetical protein